MSSLDDDCVIQYLYILLELLEQILALRGAEGETPDEVEVLVNCARNFLELLRICAARQSSATNSGALQWVREDNPKGRGYDSP